MRIAIFAVLGILGSLPSSADAGGRVLLMTDQWPIGAIPCERTRELMSQKGYEVCSKGDWNHVTPEFLQKFDVLLLGSYWPHVGEDGHVGPKMRETYSAIAKYVEAGGAVFIAHAGDQEMGKGIAAQNDFLRPLDAAVLQEMLDDADASHVYAAPSSAMYHRIFHTSKILPSPVSLGAHGLNNISYGADAGSTLQNPIRVGPDWTVVARGEDSALSKQLSGAPGTYAKGPPLVAIRSYGVGRLALWPINSGFLYLDGYHPSLDRGIIMDKESDGKVSNGEMLFYNILGWLCENSHPRDALTDADRAMFVQPIADPAKKDYGWNAVRLEAKPYSNVYKGLIGAASSLSSGSVDPQQMIDAAKAAGYAFLVFTEDLDRMDAKKWESLGAVCSANTDGGFLACPGLHFLDEAGSEYVIYSPTLTWPKEKWFSASQPGRLRWSGDIVYDGFSSGFSGWPACAVVKNNRNTASSRTIKPAMFLGHFKGFGVYTYENGQLVDDSLDTYWRLQEDSYDLYPLAIHFVKSPAEVTEAANAGYQTYVQGNAIGDAILNQCGIWGYAVGWWTFVSDGPKIDNFLGANMMGGDMADFGKEPDRLRLRIEVSSPRGLKEVRLLDGQRLAARWLPQGQTSLVKEIDRFHDRQHYYMLEVTDVDGRRAISADRWSYIEDYSNGMCRDNWNTAQQGKAFENTIKPINGFENGIPQNGAEVMPSIAAAEPDTALRPAIYQWLRASGRFGSSMDLVLYGGYAPGVGRAFHGQHLPHPICPVSSYAFTLTKREFMQRPNHPFVHLYQGRIEVREPIHLTRDKKKGQAPSVGYPPIRLYASYPTRPRAGKIAYTTGGAFCECEMAQGVERDVALSKGDFVTLYPSFCGSLTAISLCDGLKFYAASDSSGQPFITLGIDPSKDVLQPGDAFDFKFVTVRGPVAVEDETAATAKSVVAAFGVHGNPGQHLSTNNLGDFLRPPSPPAPLPLAGEGRNTWTTACAIRPTVGALNDGFPVGLQTHNGGFRASVGQADLAIDLPVDVHGLNDRIDGGIWYVGESDFAVAQRTYDTIVSYKTMMVKKHAADLIARIPILDGVARCQIDTTYGTKDVFVGNFACCDNREVFVAFPKLGKGHATVEVQNPTDADVTCTVSRADGFTLIPAFSRTLTVKAGDAAVFDVGESENPAD